MTYQAPAAGPASIHNSTTRPTFGLQDAITLARQAHDGQVDKAGRPYIEHPLRVMNAVEGDELRMIAVLHDVLEDTPVTADDLLAAGCPRHVVTAVQALSRAPDEQLEHYLRRVAANPLALRVKRADIADNSDPDRLRLLDAPTRHRLDTKYRKALTLLDLYEHEVRSDAR